MALTSRRRGPFDPEGPPRFDPDGRARSVQAIELDDRSARGGGELERLAAAYWRFLAGLAPRLLRVGSTPAGGVAIELGGADRRLTLLALAAPAHDQDAITWPITGGLLVDRGTTEDHGLLQLKIARTAGRLRLEVVVAGFTPSIARVFGRRVYALTQARVHVAVTRAFLRSLQAGPS